MASDKVSGLKLQGKLEVWQKAMIDMDLKDLTKLKFCLDESKNWQIVYSPYGTDKKSYYCNVCKMVLIDGNVVKSHNGLTKHKTSLESKVYDLLHETINPFKNVEKDNLKLTNEEIINLMSSITLEEFLEIKYKINRIWKNLLISVKNGYTCTICKSNLLTNITGVRNHISNRQHKSNISMINELHHPTFFPAKELCNETIAKKEETSNKKNKDIADPTTKALQNVAKTGPINVSIKSKTVQNKVVKDSLTNVETSKISKVPNKEIVKETKSSEPAKVRVVDINLLKPTDSENTAKSNQNQHPQQKKTVPQFLIEMGTMTSADILQIEYLNQNQKWNHMVLKDNQFFICEICNVNKLNEIPLSDHIKGKKHKDKVVAKVKRFFHPIFTEPKEETKSAQTSNDENLKVLKKNENSAPPNNVTTDKGQNQNLSIATSKSAEDKTIEKNTTREITETITVEDSPEREIVETKTVLNPFAIKAQESVSKISPKESVSKISPKENVSKISPKESVSKISPQSNLTIKEKPTVKVVEKKQDDISVNPKSSNKSSFENNEFISKLNEDLEGFVGVEYVIKIIKHAADNEPRFECCLCEVELNGPAMQFHLKGLLHRGKYLERHFPTCMKQFKQHQGNAEVMHQITERICKAIEKYHGRDLPLECVLNDYRSNRREYMSKVFSFRHAAEISGPSFTNIVDKSELQNILKNKDYKIPERRDCHVTFTINDTQKISMYPFTSESDNQQSKNIQKVSRPFPPHPKSFHQHYQNFNVGFETMVPNNTMQFNQVRPNFAESYNTGFYPNMPRQAPQYQSNNDQSLDNEEHRRLAERFIKSTKIVEKSDRYRGQTLHSPRRHRKSRSRSRSRSRRDYRSISKSPLRENDVWQAYRRKFDMDIKIIDMDFEQYYKDPQSHPLYNEEWQTFWANRMNEMKQSGRDYPNHDFTHEWSAYFPKRLEEMYDKEVEDLKLQLRKRFVLPLHNYELRDPKYHLKNTYETNGAQPPMSDASFDNAKQERKRKSSHSSRRNFEASPPTTRNIGDQNPKLSQQKNNTPLQKQSSASSESYVRNVNPSLKKGQDILITLTKRKSASAERSPFESFDRVSTDEENEDVGEILGKKKRRKQDTTRSPANYDMERELENDSPTAMHVLRLLTALEDNLGASLGPKIIDLMSRALLLEKTKPNAVDEHLLTAENCILLETCREKLKGQIVAGSYRSQQLRAVKNVIKDITDLVDKANIFRAKNTEIQNIFKKATLNAPAPKFSAAPRPPGKIAPKTSTNSNQKPTAHGASASSTSMSSSNLPENSNIMSKPSTVPLMSMAQKKDLAKKLAQALAAQGKTDISTANCEQLIEVYTLIDKKNQESGKLNTQEKSLSECLQDCIKSGSLTSLTSLIQDKNKLANQVSPQPTHNQNAISPQMQNLIMSLNNNQQNSMQRNNDFSRNFSNLANFDTSLNFGPSSLPSLNRSSFQNSNSSNMYQSNQMQNWVQGSVLSNPNQNMQLNSGPNSMLNTSSQMGTFSGFNTNNQMNQMNQMKNPFLRNNSNWQRSDNIPSALPTNNYQQNQYRENPDYDGQERYRR